MEVPRDTTWSLVNLEQMVKNHIFSYSHCCFTLTSIAFVNVWNISFIILIMGKKCFVMQVCFRVGIIAWDANMYKILSPKGCTGL